MPLLPRRLVYYSTRPQLLWVAILSLGIFSAGSVRSQSTTAQGPPDMVQAVDTETLLRQVEDQVLKGQMLSPPDNNAFQTWERVLARVSTGSPEQLKILGNFLTHIRQRVVDEQAAGNISRSVELMLFADQAERVLGIDQPEPAKEQAFGKQTSLVPPALSPRGNGVVEPVAPPIRWRPVQDPSIAASYTKKGDSLLAIKDISAARKFYEYGAEAGGARAALTLARTYDPAYIAQFGAFGLVPDVALAETWYRRAVDLGEPAAQLALERFNTSSPRH